MSEARRFARTVVTSALPYANGHIHLGHLAGAYLPADVFVRYQRLRGHPVVFICGSDEFGVPITLAALEVNVSPQEVIDRYHAANAEAFAGVGNCGGKSCASGEAVCSYGAAQCICWGYTDNITGWLKIPGGGSCQCGKDAVWN